jgi:hypothetical protein
MPAGASRLLLALGVLLAACAPAPAVAPTPEEPPRVEARAEGRGNSVEVELDGRAVTLDVASNFGIGRATVAHVGGPAPAALALRLHVRGLEELRVSDAGGVTVASVASGPGHAISQRRVAPDGAEEPIGPESPHWLSISIVAPEPDPPFPLRDGHFAVALPPSALAGGELLITWVDFFR